VGGDGLGEDVEGRAGMGFRAVELGGVGGLVEEGDLGDGEVGLRHGPVQRHPVARALLQRRAIGGHRFLQPRCAAFALAEGPERDGQIVQGCAAMVGA
jgi:hypothetical protein